MSAPAPQMPPVQTGGMRMSIAQETEVMLGHFILIGLVLASVYVTRIPQSKLLLFKRVWVQGLSLIVILGLTLRQGWVHGILAVLAFALILSRAIRVSKDQEGLADYIPVVALPQTEIIVDEPDTEQIPQGHRWFVERVLNEHPFLIREKEVKTSAIQDLSERSMGSSTSSK